MIMLICFPELDKSEISFFYSVLKHHIVVVVVVVVKFYEILKITKQLKDYSCTINIELILS